MTEDILLDEETGQLMASMYRPARRAVLAMAQTTNVKRRRKLQNDLQRQRARHARSAR